MSEEMENKALEIDFSRCCPNADAPAQPYHAIMKVDADGRTDGTLWGQGDKLMLFDDCDAAQKIMEAIGGSDFALRGITKDHFSELKKLEDTGRAELFVIVGFTPRGDVEAMPLAEHQARMAKAGNPPPLPRRC